MHPLPERLMRPLLALLLLAAPLSAAAAPPRLFMAEGTDLKELDPLSGAVIGTVTMSQSVGSIGGLAYYRPTDTLYLGSTTNDNLWKLNYSTGQLTLIGPYNVGNADVMHGLEVDGDGQLWGYSSAAAGGFRFFRIDPATGQATGVSNPGFTGPGSMGWDSSTSTMYLIDTVGDNLYTIDRASGAVAIVGPLLPSVVTSTQVGVGMAYHPSFGMYAVNNSGTDTLWRINLETGAATFIGNTGTGNAINLAFVDPPGPAGCNAADLATAGNPDPQAGPDGFLTGDDFDLFVNAFFNDLRRTSDNSLIADLVNGEGQAPPDGFLTGADFDRFLELFFQGC